MRSKPVEETRPETIEKNIQDHFMQIYMIFLNAYQRILLNIVLVDAYFTCSGSVILLVLITDSCK